MKYLLNKTFVSSLWFRSHITNNITYVIIQLFMLLSLLLINIRNNPKPRLNLVRNIFHQLFAVLYAHNISSFVNAYKNSPTLRISKSSDPLEILIPPGFLVFDVLTLWHCTLLLFLYWGGESLPLAPTSCGVFRYPFCGDTPQRPGLRTFCIKEICHYMIIS